MSGFVWQGPGFYRLRCGGVIPVVKHDDSQATYLYVGYGDLSWERHGDLYDWKLTELDLVSGKLADLDAEIGPVAKSESVMPLTEQRVREIVREEMGGAT